MVKQLNSLRLDVSSKLAELMQSEECTPRERIRAITLFAEIHGLYELSDSIITYEPTKSIEEVTLEVLQAEQDQLLKKLEGVTNE